MFKGQDVALSICLLSVALVALGGPLTATSEREDRVIIGYVFPRGRVLAPADVDATKLTHINYAFANVVNGEVVEGSPQDADNLRVLGDARRAHSHLKVLISVGGWTWSKGFSDAALTAESRLRFVDTAVSFVRRHALDGVDIDWDTRPCPVTRIRTGPRIRRTSPR